MISRIKLAELLNSQQEEIKNNLLYHNNEDHYFNVIRYLNLFFDAKMKANRVDLIAYKNFSVSCNDKYGFSFISYIENTQEYYLAKAYIHTLFILKSKNEVINFKNIQIIPSKYCDRVSTIITAIIRLLLYREEYNRANLFKVLYNIEWYSSTINVDLHYFINLIYKHEELCQKK